jgi:hypothetical protein
MPTGRFGLGVDVVNGVLYALSGEAGSFFEARAVEAYNPVSDVWTSLPLAPVGRRHLATTVLNGVIYLIGGDGGVELVETFRP